VNWARVAAGWERGLRFIAGFLQPDFTSRWTDIQRGLIESLTMTLTSTVVGVAISVPIGIGAARNLAPRWIYMICRGIIAISRALQEVIVAIFFVAMFGFGPFRRVPDAVLRHHRLHRQAAGRGHRGHRRGAGRGDPRHGRLVPAAGELRHPAAGHAAADRPVALPARHQLPRKRGDRDRRRGRHRRPR
jgi:hypothetical protein